MATLVTKNSSTAAAVPGTGDLVQGELAVNVTDKRLFTKNSGGTVVEVGTNPSTMVVEGNMGVGVTPSAWSTTANIQLATGRNISAGTGIGLYGNAYFDAGWKYIDPTYATGYGQSGGSHAWFTAPSGTAGNPISFGDAKMTLNSSGNLGIGTSSPGANLQVGASTSSSQVVALAYSATSAGSIDFRANGSAFGAGWIQHDAASGAMRFATAGTERARITSGGDLLVGTTSKRIDERVVFVFNGTTGSGLNLDDSATTGTSNTQRFYRNGTQVGTITTTTTATAYNTSSDYRLKDNPQPLTGSGAFIDALQPKTWEWKTDGSRGVGFIAHEAQAVSPSSVTGTKDAVDEDGKPVMQAMEYGSAEFIANIIAELQSLRARVAALESV